MEQCPPSCTPRSRDPIVPTATPRDTILPAGHGDALFCSCSAPQPRDAATAENSNAPNLFIIQPLPHGCRPVSTGPVSLRSQTSSAPLLPSSRPALLCGQWGDHSALVRHQSPLPNVRPPLLNGLSARGESRFGAVAIECSHGYKTDRRVVRSRFGWRERIFLAALVDPFYERLNGTWKPAAFDEFVESECAQFYAERMGRPSLCPGRYFRLLLVPLRGSGLGAGIAWRAQTLSIRRFLGLGVTESAPDHSTISRTRGWSTWRLTRVFSWVLGRLASRVWCRAGGRGRDDSGGERGVAEHRAS